MIRQNCRRVVLLLMVVCTVHHRLIFCLLKHGAGEGLVLEVRGYKSQVPT